MYVLVACRADKLALHPHEVLGLCIHLYSLAGPNTNIPAQCEEQLQVGDMLTYLHSGPSLPLNMPMPPYLAGCPE